MKKELLIATALTAFVGAGVAEAATASFSGNVRNGVKGVDTDGTADGTYASSRQSSLSFSVSETLDSGTSISSGFNVIDEGSSDIGDNSGITLTFVSGAKLDLIEAGSAYATHTASVPGASGEQGVSGLSSNHAPTGLNFSGSNDDVGFEWHSAADFMGTDGLKVGVSAGFGDDGDAVSVSTAETSFSVGVSYVSTAGDTTITVGGGYMSAADSNGGTSNDKADETTVAVSAVTGDLTIGVGYSAGSYVFSDASSVAESEEVDGAEVMTAGASYVSGDMTFAVGYADGEAKDTNNLGGAGANTDAADSLNASVSYAIASGVTGVAGFKQVDSSDEGTADTANSGSSWYIGANLSF
jgi:predicted porin